MDTETMAKVLAAMTEKGNECKEFLKGKERERVAALMQRIPDLKPGDKVRWKEGGFRTDKWPVEWQVCEVFRVFDQPRPSGRDSGNNHYCTEPDFTLIMRADDNELTEFAYDSRRFERVE
jgi:hypothetical protein